MIKLSDLRHRLTIEQVSNTTDNQGGQASTWATLATVWGKLEPIKSFERLFAQRVEYQRSHTCTIRHRTDVTTSMRISFDSRIFQIKGLRKPDEKKFLLILDLEENKGT